MSTLPECAERCKQKNVSCPNGDCRMWIDFEEENNCCLISIQEKQIKSAGKSLTLHEVGDRLGINYLKVRQIEIAALKKLSNKIEAKRLFAEIED
tara:strand:- start:178 stop:462 length:285 start_codon:yes stop_codon:yes gene_type:complete